jgi:signal transduction histidine kinase
LMSFVAPAGRDAYDDCWTAARIRDTHSADVEFRLGDQTHRLMRLELTHVNTVWLPAPWCVVFTDVTNRVRLESQSQEARKLRSLQRLAGGVAHDFNDLLTLIIGSAAMALESISPGARVRSLLEEIEGAAVHAVRMNDQLLAYAGQTTIDVGPIGLDETIRDTEPLMHALAAGKVSIESEPARDLPAVIANKMQIQQALLHLVASASESMRGQGSVSIRTSVTLLTAHDLATIMHAEEARPGRFVRIDVTNAGVGMTGHTRERMFEPFFTTRPEGRGLGLAAVLGIISRHRGAVDVETRPSGGTRVSVLLPVAQDGASETETPAAVHSGLHGTVLVVDDVSGVRWGALSILSQAGMRVMEAENGHRAIDVCRQYGSAIDIILLDATLPDASTPELSHALRKVAPHSRIVLSSGGPAEGPQVRDTDAFLQKPYTGGALLETIRGVLHGRA